MTQCQFCYSPAPATTNGLCQDCLDRLAAAAARPDLLNYGSDDGSADLEAAYAYQQIQLAAEADRAATLEN